jgi:hypothetical protein
MMRVGLYRPVHVKTLRSQKLRMLLTHRKLLQSKAIAIDNDLRGTLRNMSTGLAGTTHLFSFIGFFVRSQSSFLRPHARFAHGGARRGRQGWPSHQPFRMLRPGQAIPRRLRARRHA